MDIRHPIPNNGGDWIEKFGEIWEKQVIQLQEKFGTLIEKIEMPPQARVDVPVVTVQKDSIPSILQFMRDEPGLEYQFLADITATDEETEPRFRVVYQLFSHTLKCRFRIKVEVRDGDQVPSVVPVWPAANWAEREVWDMFGVSFKDHPNLRRILMDERWQGHPLRKDYPLRGYQAFTDAALVMPELLE